MSLVVDASALIAWLMPDEVGLDLRALIERNGDVGAPWLLWAELRNSMMTFERRGRIPAVTSENILTNVEGLDIRYDTTPSSTTVLTLCRDHRLSAYDALYLELALRRKASLVTGDANLAEAARRSGVTVLER